MKCRPTPFSTCGLRSLRKLEEMEIRGEHDALNKERKDLTKLMGSEKLKSEKLIEELKAVDAKFGLKTKIGKRRTQDCQAAADVAETVGAGRACRGARQCRWNASRSPWSAPPRAG